MFQASFVYTDEILSDFEKLYHLKGSLSPVARIICGVLGVAGAIYFGFQLYRHGFQIATAGYPSSTRTTGPPFALMPMV